MRFALRIWTLWTAGCVRDIANAWMAKKQCMRWSQPAARRIVAVRAAVVDRRFGSPENPFGQPDRPGFYRYLDAETATIGLIGLH